MRARSGRVCGAHGAGPLLQAGARAMGSPPSWLRRGGTTGTVEAGALVLDPCGPTETRIPQLPQPSFPSPGLCQALSPGPSSLQLWVLAQGAIKGASPPQRALQSCLRGPARQSLPEQRAPSCRRPWRRDPLACVSSDHWKGS